METSGSDCGASRRDSAFGFSSGAATWSRQHSPAAGLAAGVSADFAGSVAGGEAGAVDGGGAAGVVVGDAAVVAGALADGAAASLSGMVSVTPGLVPSGLVGEGT